LNLSEIRLCDFRNCANLHIDPSPRFNILEGLNGQGKTNILESIYVMASLKSFRASSSSELIRFGCTQAELRGIVQHDSSERVIRMMFGNRSRRVSIDGKSVRSMAESIGQLSVVLFAPEHLTITKGSPSERRKFLDRALFNRWPSSLTDAKRYQDVLKQRNALLKNNGSDEMLVVYDEQLADAAALLLKWRNQFLDALHPIFTDTLAELTNGQLEGKLTYQNKLECDQADDITKKLHSDWHRDRMRGSTNKGPHVDDIDVQLNGRSARSFASQGQHRAIVLALKISEIRLLKRDLGYSPILLLDDVSSELDMERNSLLMNYLCSDEFGGQVFMTTTTREVLQIDDMDHTCFKIRAGEIV